MFSKYWFVGECGSQLRGEYISRSDVCQIRQLSLKGGKGIPTARVTQSGTSHIPPLHMHQIGLIAII